MSSRSFTRVELTGLMRQAMERGDARPDGSPSVSDEQIALLASGRADELSASERGRVLAAVARDPELGRLVRELQGLGLAGQNTTRRSATRPVASRFMQAGWVAAACLTVAIGVWRFADPPITSPSDSGGEVQTLHQQPDHGEQYWEQAEKQRLEAQAKRDRLRDYALLASAGACLVLSIPVAWQLLRRRRGSGNAA